jgi:hypothetical protein
VIKLRLKAIALAILVFLPLPNFGTAAPALVVSGDPCGLKCSEFLFPSQTVELFILVDLPPDEVREVASAQYRVTGIPSGWSVSVTDGEGASSVGDALGLGVLVTFDTCRQSSAYGTAVAQRLSLVPTAWEPEFPISLAAAHASIGKALESPLVTLCDVSGSVAIEATVSPFWANGTCVGDIPFPTCGQVGVEQVTWTAVKRLLGAD